MEVDVAQEQQKRARDGAFQASDTVSDAEIALLGHVVDLEAERRLALDLADHFVPAVSDHDDGLADAQPHHRLELVVDDGLVEHGQDGFGKQGLQTQHARALAGRERDTDNLLRKTGVLFIHGADPPPDGATAARLKPNRQSEGSIARARPAINWHAP